MKVNITGSQFLYTGIMCAENEFMDLINDSRLDDIVQVVSELGSDIVDTFEGYDISCDGCQRIYIGIGSAKI